MATKKPEKENLLEQTGEMLSREVELETVEKVREDFKRKIGNLKARIADYERLAAETRDKLRTLESKTVDEYLQSVNIADFMHEREL